MNRFAIFKLSLKFVSIILAVFFFVALIRFFIEPHECPIPGTPLNGQVKWFKNSPGVAQFQCNEGYELRGASRAICQDIQWSEKTPLCLKSPHPKYEDLFFSYHDELSNREEEKKWAQAENEEKNTRNKEVDAPRDTSRPNRKEEKKLTQVNFNNAKLSEKIFRKPFIGGR